MSTQTNHLAYLSQAIQLAIDNVTQNTGGPFGAVIVKDNVVIATGINQVTKNNDPTAHAEIVAIRAACTALNSFQLNDCIIYSSCEPCPMCLGALYWAHPKALYFASSRHDAASVGFDDAFIYAQINTSYTQRSIPTIQEQIENHLAPFRAWQKNITKTCY